MEVKNRTQAINQCVSMFNNCMYLEIGVASGGNFKQITAPRKVGVDPKPAAPDVAAIISSGEGVQYYPVTSDLFFSSLKDYILPNGQKVIFDVIFIDGLHTYEQVYRDINNSLPLLNDDGVILVHGCKPSNAYCAIGDFKQFQEARKNDPTISRAWTGDVYKAIVRLRSTRKDVHVFVLDCDYGVGIITKCNAQSNISISEVAVESLTYEELASNFEMYLNLKPSSYFNEYFYKRLNEVSKRQIRKQIATLYNDRESHLQTNRTSSKIKNRKMYKNVEVKKK